MGGIGQLLVACQSRAGLARGGRLEPAHGCFRGRLPRNEGTVTVLVTLLIIDHTHPLPYSL
ncbi:MAG: hypothetical protein IKP86_14615, partial [Anaerolineaceae bacterium]|nr:hypothetical protein [Anaerolineaceae bacterium]